MHLSKGTNSSLFGFLSLILTLTISANVRAETTARTLFNDKENQVYQIRVIDIGSGDKYSIGSGFRIMDAGYLATNFHVVSSYALQPEKYRLEYVAADNSTGDLELLVVDVVHDLAIVRSEMLRGQHLPLAKGNLSKGERIYSMGNPHDLGMTIIEGTYNGLVEHSRYQKILFSGSLNPGMSGGPAFNEAGEIVGINVSTGGEQISFLVPVNHLKSLVDKRDSWKRVGSFNARIDSALMTDQRQFYETMLEDIWPEKQIRNLTIPEKLHESLKCWGHTVDEEDVEYQAFHQHCKSEDQIFISNELYVGDFNYDVEVVESKNLNRFQFYNFLEQRFTHRNFGNTYDKEEVTDFACYDNLVTLLSGSWKISTCFRAYKRYSGLYDSSMIMVSTNYPDHAAIVKISATGISADNARAIFEGVTGAISWTR